MSMGQMVTLRQYGLLREWFSVVIEIPYVER